MFFPVIVNVFWPDYVFAIFIYSAFETNYDVNKYDIDESIDIKLKLNKTIENLINADYEKIKESHISAHQKWFSNVELKLEETEF